MNMKLNQFLHLNHYTHMSLQYYTEIKMKRGGGQGGVYDMEKFKSLDAACNMITDKELSNKKPNSSKQPCRVKVNAFKCSNNVLR